MKTPQHSQLTECFQNAVHRRPREPGNPPSHGFVDLVNGGMVITLEYGTQNITALDRQRESLFAAQRLELLQPLLNVSRIHFHTRSLASRSGRYKHAARHWHLPCTNGNLYQLAEFTGAA